MHCVNIFNILVFCSLFLRSSNSANNSNIENIQGSGSGHISSTDDEDFGSSGRTNSKGDISELDTEVTRQAQPSVREVACSTQNTLSLTQLSYQPTCDPQHPEFYQPRQCSANQEECFCVNPKSGVILERTRTSSSSQASSISCDPVFFRVTLGFAMPWNSMLMNNRSTEFRDLAQKVEVGIDSAYEGDAMVGWQYGRVLTFRKGSVVADVLLTSIGHHLTAYLFNDHKALMDTFVAGQLNQIVGHKVLAEKYSFTSGDGVYENSAKRIDREKIESSSGNSIQEGARINAENNDKMYPVSTVFQQNSLNYNDVNAMSVILLAVIITCVIALFIISVLIALYCLYRVRKADEGSYALDGDQKKSPLVNHSVYQVYQRAPTQEFYA